MTRGRVCVVYGTRPEAIKLGPVVSELRSLGVDPLVLCTGQHTTLLHGTPAESDLAESRSLNLPSAGDVPTWIHAAVPAISDAIGECGVVVVQGDTMSAYAGAVAGSRLHRTVCHVEAGLRSHTPLEPWPEEAIRKAIAEHARWHYAPTNTARENLRAEGVPDERILVTGNTVVSAIARYGDVTHHPVADQQILVTMHRREWVGMGRDYVRLTIDALYDAADQHDTIRFLWPMHPNVLAVSGIDPRDGPPNLLISPPISYRESLTQLARSMGVATDSGGLQEEAATLGVPCAVLRNVSDRPESIDAGLAKLYPPSASGLLAAIDWLVRQEVPRIPSDVYGTGHAATRIAQHLHTFAM